MCYHCKEVGHITASCPENFVRGSISTGSLLNMNVVLPVTHVTIDSVKRKVLVDTGCLMNIVHVSCCSSWNEGKVGLMTINGECQQCVDVGQVNVSIEDRISVSINVLVVKFRPLNFDVILGMN